MLGWFRRKKTKKTEETPAEQAAIPGEGEQPATATVEEEETAAVVEEEAPEAEEETAQEIEAAGAESRETESSRQGQPVTVEADASSPGKGEDEKKKNRSLFARLQEGLKKTRTSLVHRLDTLFLGRKEIDQDLFDELEEILITADLGVTTVQQLLDEVIVEVRRDQLKDPRALRDILARRIRGYLQEHENSGEMVIPETGPFVIMVVGVNGVGKTTTIGKIAAKFVRAGKSVLLVAGDTFRAAAIDQLKIWGERCGVEVVAREPGVDPSSVVFDAMEFGRARGYDVIIVDTAGRLHTQVNLMEELKKIKRVMGKKLEGAPHEVMLVLDATTGQNGISQARMFNEAVGVTGVTLTKLDGTAKGGIVINVCRELDIPVRFIGVGEQVDDLREFDAGEFVDALFSNNSETAEAA